MHPLPITSRLLLLSIVLLAAAATAGGADVTLAPDFELPRWQTGERVRLGDFVGQVVVLDFFAYWCAPCEGVSKELETGVQQFYAGRHGNPQQLPVRVVSVNIEQEMPEQTAAFLERTGAEFVLNDFSASLLQPFGQAGLPFLAIVDGSSGRADGTGFRVVYQHAGFEGSRRLRRIIDGLGRVQTAGLAAAAPAAQSSSGLPIVQTIEADTELSWSSDLLLSESKLRYDFERGGTEWDAAFALATFEEQYQPFRQLDFFGFPEHLEAERYSGVFNLRQRLTDPVTLLVSGSIVDGYKDYRRVWIANRYRQKYDHPDFPRVPGYEEPAPGQWSASAGARWEYLPTLGFAEFRPSYSYERTAPGYEDGTNRLGGYKLLRGRKNIDTVSLTVSSENVLTRRIRVLNEFTLGQSTGRELRFSYQGSLNLAVGERWVLRGYGGVTTEAPRFSAQFFGLTAERELLPGLLLSLTGRYYSDTGEIESALPITSAFPPLRSWEGGLGLRYTHHRFAVKVYAGPFWTDYQQRRGIGEEFTYLYADRNWGLAQLACSLQF